MLGTGIFQAVADLASGAKARRDSEHHDFLNFYRELVEGMPSDMAKLFGTMSGVLVRSEGRDQSFGIEISVSDFIWWKRHIEQMGTRFVKSPADVQLDMLARLTKLAEANQLSPDERRKLLGLLDPA